MPPGGRAGRDGAAVLNPPLDRPISNITHKRLRFAVRGAD